MNQVSGPNGRSVTPDLFNTIKSYRIIRDSDFSDLKVDLLFGGSHEVFPVSERFRRQVYAINTSFGKFFIKFSPVLRRKDQLRFLILPWRITTEWRNLARLRKMAVPAPQRVLFGFKGRFPNHGFFLVTRDVCGKPVDFTDPNQALKLADYLAWLHSLGIFHRDIHPENILIGNDGSPILLDAQEIYFFPWLPRRLKVMNLGQLWRYIRTYSPHGVRLGDFLETYNSRGRKKIISAGQVAETADRYQQRYYRSRSKRCCKNSTEFQVIRNGRGLRGFKRRDFYWDKDELQKALARGKNIKDNKLIAYGDVCVKIHARRLFHKDRCLNSWKMSRALDVRGVDVPRALAYFSMGDSIFFLSGFYGESMRLNDYFSIIAGKEERKEAIRRFADWLRACHDLNIWQRDFKSSNVLVLGNKFMLIDLEGVRICRKLSWNKKVINLAQLNASISNRLTLKDRLRFFHFYCRENLPSRKDRRRAYHKIWKITSGKNTLPFGLDLEKL